VLTDCDDESYYVIKWMACLFDICKKKKKQPHAMHHYRPNKEKKKANTKKPRAKKRNPINCSITLKWDIF